jgi:cholest-4-en-3-one 26-monooxygenase
MKYSVATYICASRDEEVFDDPFRFDISRSPNEHAALGGGHSCPGAKLARREINLLFGELMKRVESVERIGKVKRLRSNFINRIKHLPERLTPSTQPAAA